MAYLRHLCSHQLWFEGLSVMLGCAESVQRGTSGSPSLAAVASATKPWIRFLISRSTKRIRVICNSNLKHLFKYLFGLPPARQQAKRLQLITYTLGFWASMYICDLLGFVSLYLEEIQRVSLASCQDQTLTSRLTPFPVITPENKQLMSNIAHGCAIRRN